MFSPLRLVRFLGGLATLAAAPLAAQIPTTPLELGMGGAYVGVARGHESVFLSPGNLALKDKPVWSFAFPQASLGGGIRGSDLDNLADFAEFADLTDAEKDDLLGKISEEGLAANFTLRAPLVVISRGSVGLGVAYTTAGSHSLSRDLTELMFEGYEHGRLDYDTGNTGGQRATFWEFAGSYGHRVGALSVGATGRYIHGGTLVQSRMSTPRVNILAEDVEVDYVGVLIRGGSGYAVDFGASIMPVPSLTLSGAISNAVSKMTWSDDLKLRSLTLDRTMIEDGEPEDIIGLYESSEVDFNSGSASAEATAAAAGLYDGANFPAVARLGMAWKPFRRTTLAADVHRRLNDGQFGDAWEQRIAVGVQQSLWILGFRAGYAVGDDGGKLASGGFSFGPLDLGVAHYEHGEDLADFTEGFIATIGVAVDQPW